MLAPSYAALAALTNISASTLWRRARGRPSDRGKAANQQYLSPQEEKALLDPHVGEGHRSFVETILLDERVKVNSKDRLGRTALMWAALEGRAETMKVLLHHPGIDIDGADVDGKQPGDWPSTMVTRVQSGL